MVVVGTVILVARAMAMTVSLQLTMMSAYVSFTLEDA